MAANPLIASSVPTIRISMQLTVLIGDSAALRVLDAIAAADDVALGPIWAENDTLRGLVQALHPRAVWAESWPRLLESPVTGAVIVGTSDELVSAARAFVQTRRPVWICVGSSGAPRNLFRFTPLWQEFPDLVAPLFASGVADTARMLVERLRESATGGFWKLHFTRQADLSDRSDPEQFDAAVDQLLFADLSWICECAGLPRHVTMQVSGPVASPVEVTVRLGGPEQPEVCWTLQTQSAAAGWQLQLLAQKQQLRAECAGDHLPVVTVDGMSEPRTINDTRVADMQSQLQHALQQRRLGNPAGRWMQVIQLGEIGAAARRSLKRRRTIDIHFEEVSERNQFKTQMTALGCGALIWTLLGMISLLVLGGLLDPRDREFRTADAAGFVLKSGDFQPGHAELSHRGIEILTRQAARWSSTSPVLLVESAAGDDAGLNQQRLEHVLTELRILGVRDPDTKTVLRQLQGEWFKIAMGFGWVLVFAPLGLVLGLQLLIIVARAAESP